MSEGKKVARVCPVTLGSQDRESDSRAMLLPTLLSQVSCPVIYQGATYKLVPGVVSLLEATTQVSLWGKHVLMESCAGRSFRRCFPPGRRDMGSGEMA